MVAVAPRYVAGKRREHVEEAPGDDHVVVDTGETRHGEHGPADTCLHEPPCIYARMLRG